MSRPKSFVILLLATSFVLVLGTRLLAQKMHLWVAGSKGVTLAALDSESGKLYKAGQASNHSLTWLTVANNTVYAGSRLPQAVSETDGAVSSFRIRDDLLLEFLNRVPARGKTTIYVSVNRSANTMFAANFRQDTYPSRGSVVAFEIDSNGQIGRMLNRFEHPGRGGSDSDRQLASHPHSIVIGPMGEFAAVADLGVDKVFVYRILSEGKGLELESEIAGRAGQQPRHLAWHPQGNFIYCMNEAAPTVSVARFDRKSATGEFIQHIGRIQSKGGGGADIQIDSQGRFVYGTNRGEDTIVAFRVKSKTGELELVAHTTTGGASTRSIAISPDDQWLLAANQNNHQVKVFAVDQKTGALRTTANSIEVESPACVLFSHRNGKR